MQVGGIARRLGVSRLLLAAALGFFGFLLLGAFGAATAAWASDENTGANGLAAVTDPLSAEVSDVSRLAARLVPQSQQGLGTPADERSGPGLVSGLTAPVGSLMAEPADAARTGLRGDASSGLANGMSVGDSAAGVVTSLLGTLVDETAPAAGDPADAVSGVYSTVAPVTDQVDVLARLVTDGLGTTSDGMPPGSVPADGRGQPLTTLQPATDSTEVAAALSRASNDRSAADLECSAAEVGQRAMDTAEDEARRLPTRGAEPTRSGPGPNLPDLSVIPGGAAGSSTAGVSVDGGHSAVDVSSIAAGEQVSLARTVIGELGRPLDRAAEQSVAPD
ncbi:hypothetical protein GCM10027447_21480 [Glycomyces halotolerans]